MKPYIFKDKRSRFWQVRVMHKGKQVHQFSTKTEDEDRAIKLAMIGTLGYDMSIQDRISKDQLRKNLMTLYKMGTTEDWKLYSVREYLDEWCGTRDLFVTGSSVANEMRAIEFFRAFLGDERLDGLLEALKPMHMREFAKYLVTTAKQDEGSANQRLDVVHNVLQRAVDDGFMETNPARGIRAKIRHSTLTDIRVPHQAFNRRHIHAMIEKGIAPGINPEMTIISLVSLDLGGRTGDMFGLTRGNFTLKEDLVVYHVRKVVKLHPVILFPPTSALLREYFNHHLLDKNPSAPLAPTFCVPTGDDVSDDDFRDASAKQSNLFGLFLVATGVRPPTPPRVINGKADYDHSFHSFRPTVSSALKLAGVKVEAVMARMPHKSEEVSKRYNRYTVNNICKQVFTDMGLKVPKGVAQRASLTMQEIFEEMEFALKRLKSMRGKLDLHDGTQVHGLPTWRAQLLHVDEHGHWRTRAKRKKQKENLGKQVKG